MLTRNTPESSTEPGHSLNPPFAPSDWRGTHCRSILEIDRSQWQSCFGDDIEGYDYHLGVERAGIPGFVLGWYRLDHCGELIAAAPVFTTVYDLATTAQGGTARALKSVQRFVPGQLRLRLSCLGSPVTEHCQFGFAGSPDPVHRTEALNALLSFWMTNADEQGIGLRAIKDLSEADRVQYQDVLASQGFRMASSLPGAVLPINFSSVDGYLAKLSPATRKDMRRKLKSRSEIDVEFTNDIDGDIVSIMEMYHETRARSDWAFEELTEDYFKQVLKCGQGAAIFALYRSEGKLVGANLLLENASQLLDKFFVMRTNEGKALNLYFVSWFTNVERCFARGLREYVGGQASYETKLRLGCNLTKNWICFSHRNRIAQRILVAATPLLAVPQPELKRVKMTEAG